MFYSYVHYRAHRREGKPPTCVGTYKTYQEAKDKVLQHMLQGPIWIESDDPEFEDDPETEVEEEKCLMESEIRAAAMRLVPKAVSVEVVQDPIVTKVYAVQVKTKRKTIQFLAYAGSEYQELEDVFEEVEFKAWPPTQGTSPLREWRLEVWSK